MEGFTLGLALLDAVPVLLYSGSVLLIAARFRSGLFILGAVISTLAACRKVLWKLILGIWHRDIPWLNSWFMPIQMSGFAAMLLAFLLGFRQIAWAAVWQAVTQFPAAGCFLLWLAGMAGMIWYRKTKFDNSPRANWTAEIINTTAQTALLAGLLLIR